MSGVVALMVIFAAKGSISEEIKKHVFLAAYGKTNPYRLNAFCNAFFTITSLKNLLGTACGPLFGSTAVLPFISLIFHDLHSMTSVFIHFYPPLLFYILRWKSDEVIASWPSVFHLEHDIEFFPKHSFLGTVFGNTIIAYLMWYIPYCMWIFYIGFDLPRSPRQKVSWGGDPLPAKYDTVFHSNHRKGNCLTMGNVFWGRSVEESKRQVANNDFETRDLVVYLILHFVAATGSILVFAYPSYLSKYAHGTFLVLLLIICTWRGAKRYTYYSTEMYAKLIKSKFNDRLLETGQDTIH